MRIAVSGAHRCGKSTLIARLAEALGRYSVVDEPYAQLEESGYEFAYPPIADDYLAQLECALEPTLGTDVIFDRCPLDFLAYLTAVDNSFDTDAWLEPVRETMQTLDLVVFVPIESPDRVRVAKHELPRLRRKVDAALRDLLLDDALDLGMRTIEVRGTTAERASQVRAAIAVADSVVGRS